jgi:serine/threonine protein kinase
MASNYSSDPDNAPIVHPVTPSSGPGGKVPEPPLGPRAVSLSASPAAPGPQARSSGTKLSHGEDGRQRRLSPGTELCGGLYRIEKLLASGGMGAVYRAMDVNLGYPFAIKEMLDDFSTEIERSQAVDWFKREARMLLKLEHRCIPKFRVFFPENGRYYLVMDFIEGRTLAEVLEKEGSVPGLKGARGVPEAQARSWAQQICSVLSYLHSQSPPIVFRDLKPSNIMLTESGEIKLIDFGIARVLQSQGQSTFVMTPGYAPPEQLLQGMPEPRSDIYALGSTLHRVLTYHDAVNNKPDIFVFPPVRTLRSDVSVAFEQIIMKALSPTLPQRWGSAAEMERGILALPPITVQPSALVVPPQGAAPQANTPVHQRTPSGVPPQLGLNGPGGAFIKAAQDHLSAGRIDAAYAAVQQAYAAEPNNALVHKLFGQVFVRRVPPTPDPAMQAYNRSLQLNPNDAEIHKLIGDVLLYFRQQPAAAISAYMQSLRLNAEDPETHQGLARCYEETNQLELALREYHEAARLAPQRPEFHYMLGLLARRMNRLVLADRAFVQVLILNPRDHHTRFLLSQVYEREGKLEEALRQCNFVLAAIPTHVEAQAMSQRLRTQLGRNV